LINNIEDFFILAEGGKVIFSRICNQKIEEQLLGGYLSAINGFFNIILDGDLKMINGTSYNINFIQKEKFQFIAISPYHAKNRKVRKELEYLVKRFFEKYDQKLLENCNMNVSVFESFIDTLNNHKVESVYDFTTS